MNKKKLAFFFKIFLSFAILLFLFYKVGFAELYQLISRNLKINIWFLLLAISISIITFVLGAFKIITLLRPLNRKISLLTFKNFKKILLHSMTSWSFGLFSPSRIGELSMPFFLKKEGLSLGEGFALQVIDKIITVMTLTLVVIFGILKFFNINNAILFLTVVFLTIAFVFFIFFSKFTRKLVAKYILRNYALKFKGFSKTLDYYIANAKFYLLLNIILSFIKIMSMAFVVYFLFMFFDNPLQPYYLIYIIIILSITLLSSLIPISMNGLGIKQSIGVFLYSQIGVSPLIAMGNYTIQLALNYLTATSFVSYYVWKKKK